MPILLTSTKLATKRFIKLFVDVNKSILDKQKNRKLSPAVGVIYFEVFLFLFFWFIDDGDKAVWFCFKCWVCVKFTVCLQVIPAIS